MDWLDGRVRLCVVSGLLQIRTRRSLNEAKLASCSGLSYQVQLVKLHQSVKKPSRIITAGTNFDPFRHSLHRLLAST